MRRWAPWAKMGAAKQRFVAELPEEWCSRHASFIEDEGWSLIKGTKASRKYHTPEILELVADLELREKTREEYRSDCTRRFFARFVSHRRSWERLCRCTARVEAEVRGWGKLFLAP